MNTSFSVRRLNSLVVVGVLAISSVANYAAAQTNVAPSATVATNSSAPADAAAPRTNTAIVPSLNRGFNNRHTNFVEIAKKGDIDVLFMGDSITDWWRSAGPNGGKDVFEKYFGSLK